MPEDLYLKTTKALQAFHDALGTQPGSLGATLPVRDDTNPAAGAAYRVRYDVVTAGVAAGAMGPSIGAPTFETAFNTERDVMKTYVNALLGLVEDLSVTAGNVADLYARAAGEAEAEVQRMAKDLKTRVRSTLDKLGTTPSGQPEVA
jgi:hypothetical protein